MGRPGHPILKWDQLRRAQAVYFFSGANWQKALVTELYPTSCTIIFQSNGQRDYSKRIVDLENLRSATGYDDYSDTSEDQSTDSQSNDS